MMWIVVMARDGLDYHYPYRNSLDDALRDFDQAVASGEYLVAILWEMSSDGVVKMILKSP